MYYVINTPNLKNIENKKYNYYVSSVGVFIFNVYKTQSAYNTQIQQIPIELKKIIDNYIIFDNLEVGDSLIGYKTYQNLRLILIKLIGTGIDNLRHSFVNDLYKDNVIPESKIIEQTAMAMGHSLQTHLRYRKFDPTTFGNK
jgi:hypothetical protein